MEARSFKNATPLEIEFVELLKNHSVSPIPDPLSDEDLVKLVVRFANGPGLEDAYRVFSRERNPLHERALSPFIENFWEMIGGPIDSQCDPAVEETQAEIDEYRDFHNESEIANQCERLRGHLHTLVDAGCFSGQVFDELNDSASRQAQFPIFDIQGGIVRKRYRYWAGTLGTMVDYALILMLDPTHPFGRICRCELSSCGTFFLANHVTGGRARTKYCNLEHAKEAHDARGPVRAENSRRDRAMEKRKKKAESDAHIAQRVAEAKAR
jgi:hypothetical protein